MAIDQIYLLGPEGTFSDHAARRFREYLARTGQTKAPDLSYTRSIPEALELASKRARALRHALAEYELRSFVITPGRALGEILAR